MPEPCPDNVTLPDFIEFVQPCHLSLTVSVKVMSDMFLAVRRCINIPWGSSYREFNHSHSNYETNLIHEVHALLPVCICVNIAGASSYL